MSSIFKRVIPFMLVVVFAMVSSADSLVNYGGEIPWPLSNQHVVTVTNSKGLWKLENKKDSKIYNVEMVADKRSGFDWIRISELDSKTYKVISWGEGFFSADVLPVKSQSSFWDITVEKGGDVDRFGRYISMFPNGDFKKDPYMLRLVEVDTSLGKVLGLSVIHYAEKKLEHLLGSRILNEPLSCVQEGDETELNCFLPWF